METTSQLVLPVPTPVATTTPFAPVTAEMAFAEVNRGKFPTSHAYYRCSVAEFKPWWTPENPDKYASWDAVIAVGKSYLVGDTVNTAAFLKAHRSPLSPQWQQLAFEYCKAHPDKQLNIHNNRLDYTIHWRGEYCEISLPHHDFGGEKGWVSRDGRSKVLINLD